MAKVDEKTSVTTEARIRLQDRPEWISDTWTVINSEMARRVRRKGNSAEEETRNGLAILLARKAARVKLPAGKAHVVWECEIRANPLAIIPQQLSSQIQEWLNGDHSAIGNFGEL